MYKHTTLLTILLAVPLFAQEIVINATPKSQVTSSSKETKREVLNNSKQNEFRLLITKQNGKYYWATRENRELFHTVSGAFHIFIEMGGAGYITIFDQSVLPESMRAPGANIQYKEHIRALMGDITYWGNADKFEPQYLSLSTGVHWSHVYKAKPAIKRFGKAFRFFYETVAIDVRKKNIDLLL